MRKFLIFFFIFCISSLSCFASSDISSSDTFQVVDASEVVEAIESLSAPYELQDATVSIKKVSASDTSGLKSIMLSLLGDYETVITDYTYNNGSYTSHSISIERDWSWIMSAALFIVVVFCTFISVSTILSRL